MLRDLFDEPPGDEIREVRFEMDAPRTPIGKRPLARTTDPVTSHESVPDPETLAELHRWAAECVRLSPGRTQRELGAMYCPTDPRRIGRRLNEIEKMGTVKRGDKRLCRISGRPAQTWWPV